MNGFAAFNLALAFLIELLALGAIAYWGFNASNHNFTRVGLGFGVPVLLAIVWGVFLAPKAARRLSQPALSAGKLAVFALSALALAAAGQPAWSIVFFTVATVNLVLLTFLER
jgi:hypothetical protein